MTTPHHTLSDSARSFVQILCEQLIASNDMPGKHSWQTGGTYGAIRTAIVTFVEIETGVNIDKEDWNLGGDATFADDIQRAILNEMYGFDFLNH